MEDCLVSSEFWNITREAQCSSMMLWSFRTLPQKKHRLKSPYNEEESDMNTLSQTLGFLRKIYKHISDKLLRKTQGNFSKLCSLWQEHLLPSGFKPCFILVPNVRSRNFSPICEICLYDNSWSSVQFRRQSTDLQFKNANVQTKS